MIRDGVASDIPEIVEMAEEFWQHTAYDEPFSADMVAGMSEHCIAQGLMVVIDSDEGLKGFCCGVKGPLLANNEIFVGSEVAWWVKPEFRSGRNGIGLLKGIEAAAKEVGCKYWNMVFMESSMPEKVESIYQKMGYSKTESSYSKRLI